MSSVEETPRRRQRGVRSTEEYRCEIIRSSRVKGQEYVNWKGKSVPGIVPKKELTCRCKCYDRIVVGDRNEIHERFRSFGTKNAQDAYLTSLISAEDVQRRRSRKQLNTPAKIQLRDKKFKYRINTSTKSYEVCQNAFLGIDGINQGKIRRLTTLLKQNKSPNDQRGKQKPGNAKSTETILKIVQHISSFPRKQTHYASNVREYLSEKLDISIMYSMFKEFYPDEPVNYYYYLKVFRDQFSLSFGRPQVDTCLTCEEITIKLKSKELNETTKRVVAAEKIVHNRRAKKFY